jgi:hypothetical protein
MVYIHDDILTNGFVAFYVDESFHLLISLSQLSLQHCPIPMLVFSEIQWSKEKAEQVSCDCLVRLVLLNL